MRDGAHPSLRFVGSDVSSSVRGPLSRFGDRIGRIASDCLSSRAALWAVFLVPTKADSLCGLELSRCSSLRNYHPIP